MQQPDSAQGLKKFSKKFLDDVLKLNLKTPPDIVLGLINLEGKGALQAYENSIGKDTIITNSRVKNPGSIDTVADGIRNKILQRNRPINQTDFSELDNNSDNLGYTYHALAHGIGKLAELSDYTVPSLQSVDNQFTLSSNELRKINILNNRFVPETVTTFETRVLKTNTPQQPYVDDNGQLNNSFNIKNYTPADILSINVDSSYKYTDDPLTYIQYSGKVLQSETLLMNIGALELNNSFKYRIDQALQIDNTYTANIQDAMSNPLAAINILKDPKNNLIGKNYNITVPQNIIGKAEQITGSLLGTYDLVQYLNLDTSTNPLTPTCFNNANQGAQVASETAFGRLVNDLFGKSVNSDRDTSILNNTGSGQKFQLYSNLYFNKYSPNFDPQYESGVFQAIDSALQGVAGVTGFLGLSGGKRPNSRYYFGDKTLADPFYVLQDSNGNQTNSPENITEVFKQNFDGGTKYDEPGYDELSSYGSVSSDFVWHKKGYTESFYDPITKKLIDRVDSNKINHFETDDSRLSYLKQFKECSLLSRTQNLLDNSNTSSGMNMVIDQTKTKFYDGYSLYSKGSAVIAPTVESKFDSNGELKGYSYSVPGVNQSTGKRETSSVANQSEFCRTWTKARPNTSIINAMKYSELIRLERNSVIDRYTNYNIFPSKLNVNEYTTKENSFINGVTAKKYMLSIENLAWRDSDLLKTLPNAEKGMNGGRIMWFPPYDVKFTDDTTVNWTTHQFLGRPEPIYTYNSTERSGTLSFKIIVDHPSILNVLVQKELASLSEGVVDEILNAFWSGCVNFDIYELARIWSQFSNSDIAYFQQVIAGLQTTKPNSEIRTKMEESDAKIPAAIPTNTNSNQGKTTNTISLFFENDVPILNQDSNVLPYDQYFDTYKKLNAGIEGTQNAEDIKNNQNDLSKYIKYDKIIGSNSVNKYFFKLESNDEKWYKLYQGLSNLNDELQITKTQGYNVTININAFTSSLNGQNNDYSNGLIIRRFKSVAKYILLTIITGAKSDSGDNIDINNIESFFSSDGKSITVKRDGTSKDTITIKLTANSKTLTGLESMKAIGNVLTINNIPVTIITSGSTTTNQFYCTDTQDNKNKLVALGTKIQDGVTYSFNNNNTGSLMPNKLNSNSPEVDIICSILSIQASYARRVEVSATLVPNSTIKKDSTKPTIPSSNTSSIEKPTNSGNITKRTIAQRILNKLITEEDYFQKLASDSPTVYSSMKEKLKYFTPAFHSMTPEGLNSRLTFLQQCLRPGDTIKSNDSTQTNQDIDATNTAFGKPPVCILRIGDFYNTKIIINNLNITYDPLVYDLNPEGIGVQPMIANVSISFKYLGGSGLRKHVNELQNALSFNFYANADVYDDRTFANTNALEKSLVNAETNPFDNNTLDLIPIVAKAKKIIMNDTTSTTPIGTIGKVVSNSLTNRFLGDTSYSIASQTAIPYDSSIKYIPDTYVYVPGDPEGIYGINYYKRLFDDKINYDVSSNIAGKPVSDTSAWEFVENKNFGEQVYLNLYGASSNLQTVKMNYKDSFKSLYDDYILHVNNNIDRITYDDKKNKKSSFLFNTIVNRRYTGATTPENIFDNYKKLSYNGDVLTTTVNEYYNTHAGRSNYSTLGSNFTNPDNPVADAMKLYLYPQSLFYVQPKYYSPTYLTSLITGNTYNPGYFNDSDGSNPSQESDVASIYVKNNKDYTVYYNFNESIINDLTNRINNDLLVFWFRDIKLFNNYITNISEPNKNIFRNYLINKLNNYDGTNQPANINKENTYANNIINNIHVDTSGLSYVLGGYDASLVNNEIEYQYYVIPNESRLKTQSEKLFGYDPYDSYLKILLLTGTTANYNEVVKLGNIRYKFEFLSPNINDIMLYGNGLYFFREMSLYDVFTNSNLLLDNSEYYNNSNNITLPRSYTLDNEVVTDADNGNCWIMSRNEVDNIQFDSTKNIRQTQFDAITKSLKNKNGDTTLVNKYKMSYVYEKLSYEFFDFVNKTLGLVLNDNSYNYQIDILETSENSLKNSLTKIFGSSVNDVYNNLYPNTYTEFKYYNLTTTGSTDSNYQNKVNLLAKAIDYDYKLTAEYLNYSVTRGEIEDTTPYNPFYLKTDLPYTMSSLLEAMMLDFFEDLYNNKEEHIAAIIALMKDTTSDSSKIKEKRLQKNTNIITSFFEEINTYVLKIKAAQEAVLSVYNEKVLGVLTTYFYSAFGTPDNSQVQLPGVTSANLLKGDDDDYTLTLRSNNGKFVNPDLISNLMVYGKGKLPIT